MRNESWNKNAYATVNDTRGVLGRTKQIYG